MIRSSKLWVSARVNDALWIDMGFYMNKALALDVLRTILTTESIKGRSHAPRWQQPLALYSYVCKQNGHRENPTAEVRQKISPSPGLAGRTKRAWNRSMWATERF